MSGYAIIEAADFAATKHVNQRRMNAEQAPYINHCIGVCRVLTAEGNVDDTDTLVAALLHDTVEDTDTTFEEIEARFGPTVRKLVSEVTDDKTLEKKERKRLQIEKAPFASDQAKRIKMADKIYNLRDIVKSPPLGWSEQRIKEYMEWAQKVTNGCRGVNDKLEAILDGIYADFHSKHP
ncbi:Guanosine-3',5'-bis(diphosphate) 3'-pyrophosphohydrolase MESH1 [Chytriomyces hyalinus]|nr:Guanosine-3',5'-bis(diphosphate) 3'-pyrophosphohydrolase MESH1 [Chytriomyces hyalinus]KAJ3251709.1 Guanosine-3',5'-bis(diphosphate) 3'-pyrophosphohydrolase MESH1 [Chytriomyces hyalinus]